jgi:hypothetical protein
MAVGTARSRSFEALDLDHAPGTVRILGHEARQPRRRGELVQQPASQPPMQRADDGLVLADCLTIGTVAEPKSDASLRRLALGSESERGERSAHRLLSGGSTARGRKLASQLPAGTLHLPQPSRARRNAAGQPARQLPVGTGWLTTREGIGRDRPAVARSPKRLRRALASDQTGSVEALQVNADAARVKPQLRCELIGPRRTAEARQVCEQPRPRRLSQHVTRTVGPTRSHERKLLIAGLGKVDMVFS